MAKLRFLLRWYATACYDYSGNPMNSGDVFKNISGGIAFQPSEFSELKLEYRRVMPENGVPVNEVKVLAIFTIGAHGPHAF